MNWARSQPATNLMSTQDMQQSWSHLMRSGKVRPSAAQCLVEMPPEYSKEAPPMPAVLSQSMHTIGLHAPNGNRPVKRSSHFTSDFRDPFEGR